MNKAELIEALAVRLGDKRAASTALDAVLAEVQAAVAKGDKVSITGFGVFEKRARAARMARNPRTGEAVRVRKTSVPAFRPGAGFKEMVASGRVPKALKAPKKTAAKATKAAGPAKKTATAKATKAPATKAPARKTAAKAATRKTATGRATPARKTAAKATTGRATAARKTAAKKAPAKKATAKKATAKKATKRR